jgi:O-antigen/teichoic acid export membrane protein
MLLYLKKLSQNKVVKNFSYVTIGSILAQLLNLVALIKISKILTPENYGLYTFLTVQAQLVFTIADLGIRNIIIRTISRDKYSTKNMVYNGIIIKLISVVLISVIYFIYNKFFGTLNNQLVLYIFIYSFFNCISILFESTFWGHQKMLAPAVVNVSTSVIWLLFVIFFAQKGINAGSLFLVFTGINLLTCLSYFWILKSGKLIAGIRGPFASSAMALLKQSWPYFVLVLLGLPYNYLTNNFLDLNSTKKEIGYFNLSQKLMSPVSLVIMFSLSALFPNLSNLWVTDQEKFKNLIRKGIDLMFLGALMLCFLYTAFAEYIIKLFFSSKYYSVIEISQMQIWFVFLMGINSFIGTIWGATNNEKLLVKSSVINSIIALPILYIGSKYGALGLSYGYVISFALFEIYLWIDFKKSIKMQLPNDIWLWIVALVIFSISYFVINKVSLILKISICLIIIIMFALYYLKFKKSRVVN